MMKLKSIALLVVSLIIGLGTAVFPFVQTPSAVAGAPGEAGPNASQAMGSIQVKVLHSGAGGMAPETVVLYNQDGVPVRELVAMGGVYTFSNLKVGDYYVLAESDAMDPSQSENVPVFADETTQLTVKLEKPGKSETVSAPTAGGWGVCGGSMPASSGDGNMVKVYPATTENTIIYIQCGRIVGKTTPACGCRGSNYHYTTNCPKGNTIYVTLPCTMCKKPKCWGK
jgi:hypothetical protein